MPRIIYLIDGFNLYHSVLQFQDDTKHCTKWLDIAALCESYLPSLGGRNAILSAIYYFSAMPDYLKPKHPDKIVRQENYNQCLTATGIKVELGRFKEKLVKCEICKKKFIKHEEKETDVAIAIKLFEIFYLNRCDAAVIVSGDTDIAPAVRTCQRLFPGKKILFAFPYARKNRELAKLAPDSFKISGHQYLQYQLPNPVILPDGTQIPKPATW